MQVDLAVAVEIEGVLRVGGTPAHVAHGERGIQRRGGQAGKGGQRVFPLHAQQHREAGHVGQPVAGVHVAGRCVGDGVAADAAIQPGQSARQGEARAGTPACVQLQPAAAGVGIDHVTGRIGGVEGQQVVVADAVAEDGGIEAQGAVGRFMLGAQFQAVDGAGGVGGAVRTIGGVVVEAAGLLAAGQGGVQAGLRVQRPAQAHAAGGVVLAQAVGAAAGRGAGRGVEGAVGLAGAGVAQAGGEFERCALQGPGGFAVEGIGALGQVVGVEAAAVAVVVGPVVAVEVQAGHPEHVAAFRAGQAQVLVPALAVVALVLGKHGVEPHPGTHDAPAGEVGLVVVDVFATRDRGEPCPGQVVPDFQGVLVDGALVAGNAAVGVEILGGWAGVGARQHGALVLFGRVARGAQQNLGGGLRLPEQAGAGVQVGRAGQGSAGGAVLVPEVLCAVAQGNAGGQGVAQRGVQHAFGQMMMIVAQFSPHVSAEVVEHRRCGAHIDGASSAAAAKEGALGALEHLDLLGIQGAEADVRDAGGHAIDIDDDRVVVGAGQVERAHAADAHVGAVGAAPRVHVHARRAAQDIFHAGDAAGFQIDIIGDVDGEGQILCLFLGLAGVHGDGRQGGGTAMGMAALGQQQGRAHRRLP